jgi:hypothetical protein
MNLTLLLSSENTLNKMKMNREEVQIFDTTLRWRQVPGAN